MLVYVNKRHSNMWDELNDPDFLNVTGFSISRFVDVYRVLFPEIVTYETFYAGFPKEVKFAAALYYQLVKGRNALNIYDDVMLAVTVMRESCVFSPSIKNRRTLMSDGFMRIRDNPADVMPGTKRTVPAYGLLQWQNHKLSGLQELANVLKTDRTVLAQVFPYLPGFVQLACAQVYIKRVATMIAPKLGDFAFAPSTIDGFRNVQSSSTFGWKTAVPAYHILVKERDHKHVSYYKNEAEMVAIKTFYPKIFNGILKGDIIKYLLFGAYKSIKSESGYSLVKYLDPSWSQLALSDDQTVSTHYSSFATMLKLQPGSPITTEELESTIDKHFNSFDFSQDEPELDTYVPRFERYIDWDKQMEVPRSTAYPLFGDIDYSI